MTALLGAFELLAVELAGIHLVVVERFERGRMASGIERPDVLVRVQSRLAQTVNRKQMPRGRGGIGKREAVTLDPGDAFDAAVGVGDDARPVSVRLAVIRTECGDSIDLCDLVRQHKT